MEIEALQLILTLGAGAAVGTVGMYFMFLINTKSIGALTEAINGLVAELKEMRPK